MSKNLILIVEIAYFENQNLKKQNCWGFKTNYHAVGEILAKVIDRIMLSLWWLLPPPDPLLTFIFSLATPLTCNIYRTQEHVGSFTRKIYWIQNTLKELIIFLINVYIKLKSPSLFTCFDLYINERNKNVIQLYY